MPQGGICAVVVLFRMRAEQSAAYRAVQAWVTRRSEAGGAPELMVCDNSPVWQAAPAAFAGTYGRDPSNPGLARSYNRALKRARETGAEWLMLLDQDTAVTEEYLRELEEALPRMPADVVAVLPKLVDARGAGLSPHRPPGLRHHAGELGINGVVQGEICGFNSGAVLRVRALEAAGGFDEEFWLDFLDHATLRTLQRRGGRVWVMRSQLPHALSLSGREQPGFSVARHRNSVEAERLFYATYGSALERWWWRVRSLKNAGGALLRRDWERTRYVLGAVMGTPAAERRESVPADDATADRERLRETAADAQP